MKIEHHNEIAKLLIQWESSGGEVENGDKVDYVLNSASDVDSPLHELFQWDDSVAAYLYRKEQAIRVLSKFKIKAVEPTLQNKFLTFKNLKIEEVPTHVGLMRSTPGGMEVSSHDKLLTQLVALPGEGVACSTGYAGLLKRYGESLEFAGLKTKLEKHFKSMRNDVLKFLSEEKP